MSRAYIYTVKRDYGFAPNPFHGMLTLATCKPGIRKSARVGDYIIGHSDKASGNKLIYMMKVSETMTYDEYWNDPRFFCKRPVMNGSLVKLYGDNIYHHNESGVMVQEDSHHSNEDGTENRYNMSRDTKSNKVLISKDFFYFGGLMIDYPTAFSMLKHPYIGQTLKDIPEVDQLWDFLEEHYPNKEIIGDPVSFRTFQRYDGRS